MAAFASLGFSAREHPELACFRRPLRSAGAAAPLGHALDRAVLEREPLLPGFDIGFGGGFPLHVVRVLLAAGTKRRFVADHPTRTRTLRLAGGGAGASVHERIAGLVDFMQVEEGVED